MTVYNERSPLAAPANQEAHSLHREIPRYAKFDITPHEVLIAVWFLAHSVCNLTHMVCFVKHYFKVYSFLESSIYNGV